MKNNHSAFLVDKVCSIVRDFATLGDVYILQGNHDFDDDPKCPFFGFLEGFPHVHWIGTSRRYEQNTGLGKTLWMPYARNWEVQWKAVDVPPGGIVFAHGMFNRTKLGNGREAENVMPLSLIPKGVKCYAGDVHIPQVLERVEYVGAPYTIDFGDQYDARAIVLDDRRGRMDIDLSKLPQKRLVNVIATGPKIGADLAHCNPGDILKVRIPMLRSDSAHWPRTRDKCRTWLERSNYVVHEIVPVVRDDPGARVLPGKRHAEKSDMQVFDEFVKRRAIDPATRKQGERLL